MAVKNSQPLEPKPNNIIMFIYVLPAQTMLIFFHIDPTRVSPIKVRFHHKTLHHQLKHGECDPKCANEFKEKNVNFHNLDIYRIFLFNKHKENWLKLNQKLFILYLAQFTL